MYCIRRRNIHVKIICVTCTDLVSICTNIYSGNDKFKKKLTNYFSYLNFKCVDYIFNTTKISNSNV